MLRLPRIFSSLSTGWPLLCAPLLGLALAPRESPALDDIRLVAGEEEEEPEKLIGLLDPALAKPLMTLEEEKSFGGKKLREYTNTALKSLSLTNSQKSLVDEGARYRVLRMTIPENWPDMANMTNDLIKDLSIFARSSDRAREHLLRASVKELDALVFSDQPAFVKINAALLLGRLTKKNASITAKTPAVPYEEAAVPLAKILTDPQQRLDVKIPAVKGLARIMTFGEPSRATRDKIAKALTDELNGIEKRVAGDGRDWYQWSLIDALGAVKDSRSMTQETYVVDVLWKTMHNEKLPWHLRTRAVRSLGQLKLDASFNVHLLVHEIVLLTGKMSSAYNANVNQSFWPLCFSDVYFAFKAAEARQQQQGWGLLQNPPATARQVVDGAYQQVLPLVNAVLKHEKPQRVPGALLGPTSEWLKANKPADDKIHQNARPLAADKPAPAAPSNAGDPDTKLAQPASGTSPGGL